MRVPNVYASSRVYQPLYHLAMSIRACKMQDRVPSDSHHVVPGPFPKQQLDAFLSPVHLQHTATRSLA